MKPNSLSILGLTVISACVVAACGGGGSDTASTLTTVAGAPTIASATAGNASASIAFTAPASNGGSAITGYTATCTASGASKTGTATSSPVAVSSLTNGTAYSCSVIATNAVGASTASAALTVTPLATITTSNSLNAVYKNVAWQTGVTVTFPTDCTMTYTSNGVPSHATDAYYLEPVRDVGGAVVATTPVSGMALGTAAYGVSTKSMTQTFNTCPTKAATTTATTGGAIGWMISGSAMFNATEGANNTTAALTDNVSYTFTDVGGVSRTAKFIDSCNGHPTPLMYTYHYHGLPACVTALVDSAAGASHIIGIANDGFPIYGNKDINGKAVGLDQLDACNGITSATAEFPSGVYHYVLPDGVTSLRSSMGCYTGTVSTVKVAAAAIANGICYGTRPTEQRASALSIFSAGNRSSSRRAGA
jgi:YHYH protein/Fibronectin type III domain